MVVSDSGVTWQTVKSLVATHSDKENGTIPLIVDTFNHGFNIDKCCNSSRMGKTKFGSIGVASLCMC